MNQSIHLGKEGDAQSLFLMLYIEFKRMQPSTRAEYSMSFLLREQFQIFWQ